MFHARKCRATPLCGDNSGMAVSNSSHPTLVLGSTSRYRQELLSRLRLPFVCRAPEVGESALPGELPAALATRLALAKAEAVARAMQAPRSSRTIVVVGSDQVADLNGVAIGKPGGHRQTLAQLQAMRGQTVAFHTAVAVVRPATQFSRVESSLVRATFRADISDAELDHYLHRTNRTTAQAAPKWSHWESCCWSGWSQTTPPPWSDCPDRHIAPAACGRLFPFSRYHHRVTSSATQNTQASPPKGRLILIPNTLDLGCVGGGGQPPHLICAT